MKSIFITLGVIGFTVFMLTPPSWAIEPPEFVLEWGTNGTGEGQFYTAAGIAVDVGGNVYVSDWAIHRIQKFSNTCTWLAMWGSYGSEDGQFAHPHGIAVDISGNVYVADSRNNRIQKFSTDGSFLTAWGTAGSGEGQFGFPMSVAVDADGYVYAADWQNNRIQKFTDTGAFLTAWGSEGTGEGQFYGPKCVAIGAGNVVYVSEELGNRVQKFTSTGSFLTKWGSAGSGDGEMNGPYGVVESHGGLVYVTDTFNNRIQVFTTDGIFLMTWGAFGSGPGEFYYPTRLATDSAGNIYVVDQNNHRIQKFKAVNTNVGSDVVVDPVDPATGSSPLTITFTNVTGSGETSLEITQTGPAPPLGFKLGNPPAYYELTTTAEFTGAVEICVDYSSLYFGQEKNLKLFHREDGHWEDRTTSLDTLNNIICAEVTSFSTLAIFELNIGTVAGHVTAECLAPGTGLIGVEIDAYSQGTGELVGTDFTDADGYYQIDGLEVGEYVMTIVTPIGYAAVEDEIPTMVIAGETATADFGLKCLDVTPSQRSIGYWKHQVAVATGSHGNADIGSEMLCDYLDLIEEHFNNNAINEVKVYVPAASGLCSDKLEEAKDLLNLKGNVAMIDRAEQQLMGLLLNVASGKIGLRAVISIDGANVSQAITYCDNLIDDPTGDHETAKTICDWINNAIEIPANIVPSDIADIAYSPPRGDDELPEQFELDQNYPNPFNPSTAIHYNVPEGGGAVTLEIFDVSGRLVRKLVDGERAAGQRTATWDGTDTRGRSVSTGVYFYRLKGRGFSQTKKMLLVK